MFVKDCGMKRSPYFVCILKIHIYTVANARPKIPEAIKAHKASFYYILTNPMQFDMITKL